MQGDCLIKSWWNKIHCTLLRHRGRKQGCHLAAAGLLVYTDRGVGGPRKKVPRLYISSSPNQAREHLCCWSVFAGPAKPDVCTSLLLVCFCWSGQTRCVHIFVAGLFLLVRPNPMRAHLCCWSVLAGSTKPNRTELERMKLR